MRFPLIRTTPLTLMVLAVAGMFLAGLPGTLAAQQMAAPNRVYDRPGDDWSPGAPGSYGDASGAYSEGPMDCQEGGGMPGRVGCPDDCGPRWTVGGEILALQRAKNGDQPLFLDPVSAAPVLSSGDLNFPLNTGFELNAVRHNVLHSCFDVEVGYFQTDFAQNSGVTGLADLQYGTNALGAETVGVTGSSILYRSELHLGEVNVRHEWFDGLTLLAGFRMGELDEHYGVSATNATIPGAVALDARTFNHLYGFQVGADAELFDACRPFQLHVLCKAGIYGNSAYQTNVASDTGNPYLGGALSATHDQATFIGETGLLMTYRVNCHWAFRVTATATWIDGVALAPEQVGTTSFVFSTATVDTGSSIFYYGGGIGTELRF